MAEKFYRLTHEEWMRSQALKPAERDVLFYLKTLDPFGDGVEVVVSEIAIALGRNKGTISRALKVLANGDWIDLEMVKVKVKVKSCVQTTALCTDNSVVYTQPEWPVHNSDGRDTTCAAVTQLARPVHNNQPLEPTPSAEPTPPKTLKTYSDFQKTLSDCTRESFEKFAFHKIQEARIGGEAIALPDRWLNKHWPTYWAEFEQKYPVMAKASSGDKISPAQIDEEVNIIKAAIANGTLLDYDTREDYQRDERGGVYLNRPKVRSYIVQVPVTETWVDFEEWRSAGGENLSPPDPQQVAEMRQLVEGFIQTFAEGGEPCR